MPSVRRRRSDDAAPTPPLQRRRSDAAARVPFDALVFRYLLREGRLALLFDGFDELALQVRYDRATAHLETLLQAAEGRARVVVTSRTQHFVSDR